MERVLEFARVLGQSAEGMVGKCVRDSHGMVGTVLEWNEAMGFCRVLMPNGAIYRRYTAWVTVVDRPA